MNERTVSLSASQLATLRRSLNSPVLAGNDQEFDRARRVWNGMIDRSPSVIVRPRSIADVIQSVRFAREQGVAASVRGGGHSVAGKSVADGAMMIDLSLMKHVEINPSRQTALAQGGATWGEFDCESEKFGLATTGGVISSTGVCGLTLGGGIGWLMGKHGLSCDNVLSADLVNAEGEHLSVNATNHEDLFWAIRGGGGNFGIITALEFRLHELGPVHAGATENLWGPYTIGYLEWDGASWQDEPSPSFVANEDWEHGSVYEPNLIYHDGKWKMWYVAGSNQENYFIHGYAESWDGRSGWSKHVIFAPPEIKLFDFCVRERGGAFEAVFARVSVGTDSALPETGLWWCCADRPYSTLSEWSSATQIMDARDCGWHSGAWKPSLHFHESIPDRLIIFFDGLYRTDEPGPFPFAFTLGCLECDSPRCTS